MKKLALILAAAAALGACTAPNYAERGDATIFENSNAGVKDGKQMVKLLLKTDNGETFTAEREYDPRYVVGSRVYFNEDENEQKNQNDFAPTRRLEFK